MPYRHKLVPVYYSSDEEPSEDDLSDADSPLIIGLIYYKADMLDITYGKETDEHDSLEKKIRKYIEYVYKLYKKEWSERN